jgi:hypothetical protein
MGRGDTDPGPGNRTDTDPAPTPRFEEPPLSSGGSGCILREGLRTPEGLAMGEGIPPICQAMVLCEGLYQSPSTLRMSLLETIGNRLLANDLGATRLTATPA